ncbi:MAG: hypothetical protein C5B50_26650 [Verrucomicrobia bacterium]|nr:MAG: hypothetical protein C5B50_26650 [Verrucomicrobiota bacterium]
MKNVEKDCILRETVGSNLMTKVAILPEPTITDGTMYRAVAGGRQAVVGTVGGALDALTAQLSPEESGTLIVIQNHKADQFFTSLQQQRLEELMIKWRKARDAGKPISTDEQSELNELIDAEVQAAGERAAAALAALEK